MMSRPASSCSLIHSRVASRLAASSSGPLAFQLGQSFRVSASQAGFGRLPAMEVGNREAVAAFLEKRAPKFGGA